MKLSKQKLLVLSLSLLILPGLIQARMFRAADTHSQGYPTVAAVVYMGKLLSSETNGRLGIKEYPGRQLGEESDTLEQTINGSIDIDRVNMAVLNGIDPMTAIPALPYIFRSIDQMHRVMDGKIGDKILKSLKSHGLIGLAFYDSGARSFYNTKRPIRTPADMKGLKIRVQNSDLFIAMIKALGANATPMEFGQVYTALKTGVIDGAENNWPSYQTTRHYEVAKYYSLDEHSMSPEILVMSKITWDKLSKSDQKLIRKAAKKSVPYMRKLWKMKVAASKKIVLANGNKVIFKINKQPFIDAMKPVYKRFVSTPALKQMVKEIRAVK